VPDLANEGQTDSLTRYDAAEKGGWKLLSSAVAAIIGALIGAIATTAGVIVQAVLKNRADAEQRREARESVSGSGGTSFSAISFSSRMRWCRYDCGLRTGLGAEVRLGRSPSIQVIGM
jgi:hypothetical protein